MIKSIYKKIILMVSIILLLNSYAFGADPANIIINSQDWKDVYSLMLYGSLAKKNTNFIISDRHGTLILNSIPKEGNLWLINSNKEPILVGYDNIIRNKGYQNLEVFNYDNVNIELAKLIKLNKYVIIDGSYGYNSISVAPYAVSSNSFVLFADNKNIGDIVEFLDGINVQGIIIYGIVDREVRDALEKFNPEIINKEGDRFANNIEIVKKYQELNNAKQAILTNGEFIEKEIMAGTEPVVFIGSKNVPDQVKEYIKESNIQIGILIGNELVSSATLVRRQLGISVFVKFAQGARNPSGPISRVEALDMYYLPAFNMNLEIISIKYNRATQKIEITLRNSEAVSVYFQGTYTLKIEGGGDVTFGDNEPIFIGGNEIKTLVYDINDFEGSAKLEAYIIYGESPGSLEREIRSTLDIEVVKIIDNCEIDIDNVILDKGKKIFYVNVKNTGSVDCYVDIELVNIIVASQKTIYGLEKTAYITKGEAKELRIKTELTDEDFEDNERVTINAYFGEREDSLIKVIQKKLLLLFKQPDYLFYSLLIIIIALIILLIWKRRKKKQENK